MSPSKTGAGRRISSHPRFAKTFWETSVTDWPVTRATVKVESTSGLPNSVWDERWWSKWMGAVFWVKRVNRALSVVVTVRPRGCS